MSSESELLLESLRLMAMGMGIVFGFLLLLVGILRLMSTLVVRLAPAELVPVAVDAAAPPHGSDHDDLIAVITAALARYRRHH